MRRGGGNGKNQSRRRKENKDLFKHGGGKGMRKAKMREIESVHALFDLCVYLHSTCVLCHPILLSNLQQ